MIPAFPLFTSHFRLERYDVRQEADATACAATTPANPADE